jgi:hypothetical protein
VAALSLMSAPACRAAWSAPQTVASSRVFHYSRPVLAANAAGEEILAWHREEELNETLSGIEASTRRQGAPWSAAVALGSRKRDEYDPRAGIDSRGDAVVVWDGQSTIEAATHPASGPWSHIVDLSSPRGSAEEPQLAVAGNGGATAAFAGEAGASMQGVQLAVRRPGGRWQRPRTVARISNFGLHEPQLASDARGETIVAWIRYPDEVHRYVQAVVLDARGRPEGPAQTLSPRNGRGTDLHLAVNARGDAVLVWRQEGHTRRPVEAAIRLAGGRFTRPATVSRLQDAEPTAAIDASGDATIVFTRILSTQPSREADEPLVTQTTVVESTTRPAHGHWTKPTPIARPPGSSAFEAQIAAGPSSGELMAIWTNARFRSRPGTIEAAFGSSDGAWQKPVVISASDSRAPSLTFSVSGQATAAWIAIQEATNSEAVDTADYSPG